MFNYTVYIVSTLWKAHFNYYLNYFFKWDFPDITFAQIISNLMSLFHIFRHHLTCFTVLNLLLFLSQTAQFEDCKSLNMLCQLSFLNGLYQTVQPPTTTNKPPRTTNYHLTPPTTTRNSSTSTNKNLLNQSNHPQQPITTQKYFTTHHDHPQPPSNHFQRPTTTTRKTS